MQRLFQLQQTDQLFQTQKGKHRDFFRLCSLHSNRRWVIFPKIRQMYGTRVVMRSPVSLQVERFVLKGAEMSSSPCG